MIVRRRVPCRASLQRTEGDDDYAWMAFMPYLLNKSFGHCCQLLCAREIIPSSTPDLATMR